MRTNPTHVSGIHAALAAIAGVVTSCHHAVPVDTRGRAEPRFVESKPTEDVPRRLRGEVGVPQSFVFDVPDRTRDPDEVVIDGEISTPSGRALHVGGFPYHGRFQVRFTAREAGRHSVVITADGGAGRRRVVQASFDATKGTREHAGFTRIDPEHPHRLVRGSGTTVFVLGENRINVYDPSWNEGHADIPTYVERMAHYGMSTIRVFVFSDCESETVSGGYQIGCLEPNIGRFDERTADAFDALFDAAEKNDVDVILVPFALGFTPAPETWKSWEDNPYSTARGGPVEDPRDFFSDVRFRPLAERRLRYVADRWGASPRLLAVDLLNEPEWDGRLPETTWIPWAEAMSDHWRSIDAYGHLVTAGPVGLHWNLEGDERPWYASPKNDLVQWHLYGKDFYDPRALGPEMMRKVAETWSYGKPVFCGEFAYGGEDKTTYDHTHVGLWSLLFSGAGALAHSAPPFEIDSDEPMTPARGEHFRVLSETLRSLDPRRAFMPRSDVRATIDDARALSLANDDASERAVWILGPTSGYGSEVVGLRVAFPAPPAGTYGVTWKDDTNGREIARSSFASTGRGDVVLDAPTFSRHTVMLMRRP